jgi:hypothetical protein
MFKFAHPFIQCVRPVVLSRRTVPGSSLVLQLRALFFLQYFQDSVQDFLIAGLLQQLVERTVLVWIQVQTPSPV